MGSEKARRYHNNKVLVVDDEEVVRLLFENLFQEEGLDYLQAEDAGQAVAILERQRPAVVLVDKNLPDRSGVDLIAEQKRLHPDIEFIMITGYASLDSAVRAMESGAFSYLTKPFDDIEVVLERVRAALDVTHLRLETANLQKRLQDIGSPADEAPQPAAAPSPRLLDQVLYAISLLESFRDKRDQVPSAAAWARTVDTLEATAEQLRQALEAHSTRGE